MYFQSMELTGSNEGTEKNPKVSLLQVYDEQIIPALETKVVAAYNQGGTRRVIIVKQEDGAGLHQDSTYVSNMQQ